MGRILRQVRGEAPRVPLSRGDGRRRAELLQQVRGSGPCRGLSAAEHFAHRGKSERLDSPLGSWIAPGTVGGFIRSVLHRRAFARAGVALSATSPCDWNTVGHLLQGAAIERTLIVARGELLMEPVPRSLD